MTKKIKWFAIQPLTGGMYLGAEEAIGNSAEAILSFNGLNDYKLHKLTGEPIGCGNERYLTNYLTSKNRMPNYYIFKDKTMFGDDVIDDVNLSCFIPCVYILKVFHSTTPLTQLI